MDTLKFVPSPAWLGSALADRGSVATWRTGDTINASGAAMGARYYELGQRVCDAYGREVTRDTKICRGCGQAIRHVTRDTWATADEGLSYCPPDPDYDGEHGEHDPRDPVGAEWITDLPSSLALWCAS